MRTNKSMSTCIPNETRLYSSAMMPLCIRWDGKDRIRALAGLVPCNNPYWRELFYRWFLNMDTWLSVMKTNCYSGFPMI